MWTYVSTGVDTSVSRTIPAGTGTARNAKACRACAGSNKDFKKSFPYPTSTWSSLSRMNCTQSSSKTSKPSTTSCSRPLPNLCSNSHDSGTAYEQKWDSRLSPYLESGYPLSSSSPHHRHRRRPGPDSHQMDSFTRQLSCPCALSLQSLPRQAPRLSQTGFCQKHAQFPDLQHLQQSHAFQHFIRKLYRKKWVVYCKRPFGGPEQVIKYLGLYTHKVAISNHRLVDINCGMVTFLARDNQNPGKKRSVCLPADKFIRRFLTHILPSGFVKIRHYGLMAAKKRKDQARKSQNAYRRNSRHTPRKDS